MLKNICMPLYAKACILVVGLIAFFWILYTIQEIVIPLIFAVIIAIVLNPIVKLFTQLGLHKIIAITLTITISFILIAGIGILIVSQAIKFSESWPMFLEKITLLINKAIANFALYFNIKPQNIHNWILRAKQDVMQTSTNSIGNVLMAFGSWLMIFLLLPVYIFLILFYQSHILVFIHKIFVSTNQIELSKIITKIKLVIQQYLIGLIFEIIIVSVLNTVALLLIGVEYALLLGVLAGFLNLIPYIGGIVAISLPILVSLTSNTSLELPLYIIGLFSVIQIIDNYVIVPIIVASKVKINALFSIIIVIAGNAIWGISGMLLSIPLLAIVKVIFDHITQLQPLGLLLGESIPVHTSKNLFSSRFKVRK